MRIATYADDDEVVAGPREALLGWGPDAGLVGDAAIALDQGNTGGALNLLKRVEVLQPEARRTAARLTAEAYLDRGMASDAVAVLKDLDGDDAQVTLA